MRRHPNRLGLWLLVLCFPGVGKAADPEPARFQPVPEKGQVGFQPTKTENSIPKRYRQAMHQFPFAT